MQRRTKRRRWRQIVKLMVVNAVLAGLVTILYLLSISDWLSECEGEGGERGEGVRGIWEGMGIEEQMCEGPNFAALKAIFTPTVLTLFPSTLSLTSLLSLYSALPHYFEGYNLQIAATCDYPTFSFSLLNPTKHAITEGKEEMIESGEVAKHLTGPKEYIIAFCSLPPFPSPFLNLLPKIEPSLPPLLRSISHQLRLPSLPDGSEGRAMHVIVLLISALSDAHLERMLPSTHSYLHRFNSMEGRKLSSRVFHFENFHSMAHTPLDNQIPLFTGRSHFDQRMSDQDFKSSMMTEGENDEWLWSWYQKHGYVTIFSEGHCMLHSSIRKYMPNPHMIDHRFTELYCQSTLDHSANASDPLNPLFSPKLLSDPPHLEEGVEGGWGWRRGRSCVGNRAYGEVALEAVGQMMKSYPDYIPKMATAVLMDAHEPSMMRVKLLDRSILSFLNSIASDLHHTAVIIASEIGGRKDSPYNRFTAEGKEEIKQPLLYMLMPEIWLQHYPHMMDSLTSNQLERTSIVDLYSTLRRIPLIRIPASSFLNSSLPIQTFSPAFQYRSLDPLIPSHAVSLVDERVEERSCANLLVPKSLCRCPHRNPPLLINFFTSFLAFAILLNLLLILLFKFNLL